MKIINFGMFLTDVIRHEDKYEIVCHMPGFTAADAKSIRVEMDYPDIVIFVDKDFENQNCNVNNCQCEYVIKETPDNIHISRRFTLPNMTKFASNIDAVLKDGILHLYIPFMSEEEEKTNKTNIRFE